MIYLYTSADGKNTEGIGAMAQYQIHTYTLSRALGVEFIGQNFTNLQHYQKYSTQEQFNTDCSKFFNFPSRAGLWNLNVEKFDHIDDSLLQYVKEHRDTEEEKFVEINNFALMHFADSNIDWWSKHNLMGDLIPRLEFDQSNYYLDEEKLNIAVHIRNFVSTDNDPSPTREYFERGNEKEKYFVNLINNIEETFDFDKEFHIYSQGDESQFETFLNLGWNVTLHLDEHPLTSLYHMIKSDIRVMSNSSMSYLAALYSQGLSIARDNFPHKTLNTVYTDYEGNFDKTLLSVHQT